MTTDSMSRPRILFVDDEPTIRMTLPRILESQGFQVTAAADISGALAAMHGDQFDVLLTDLNIGEPGDGFTVVSAMRRTQPRAVTIILTGYPAFETALEAIRNQVDHYVVKPANIKSLVESINQLLGDRRRHRAVPLKRLGRILHEHQAEVVERWFSAFAGDPEVNQLGLAAQNCVDFIPEVISGLVAMLESDTRELPAASLEAASRHGIERRSQGFPVPLLATESRLLRRTISEVVQDHLISVDVSYLIPDLARLSDSLDTQMKLALEAHTSARAA